MARRRSPHAVARRGDWVAQLRATRLRRAPGPGRPLQLLDGDLHQVAAGGAVRACLVAGLPETSHTPEFSFEHEIDRVGQATKSDPQFAPVSTWLSVTRTGGLGGPGLVFHTRARISELAFCLRQHQRRFENRQGIDHPMSSGGPPQRPRSVSRLRGDGLARAPRTCVSCTDDDHSGPGIRIRKRSSQLSFHVRQGDRR
jgi:hypothetical protein